MALGSAIGSKYRLAISTRCEKVGCALNLGSLSPKPVVLDGDLYKAKYGCSGKICDFLIFLAARELVVVLVEMKSGSLDSSHAASQLKASSEEVSSILAENTAREFYALVLAGRISHASQLKALRAAKISFQGKNYPVIWAGVEQGSLISSKEIGRAAWLNSLKGVSGVSTFLYKPTNWPADHLPV